MFKTMSFSNIRLPDEMIAAIYGSSLVLVPSTRHESRVEDIPVKISDPPTLSYLGNNEKNTAILVYYPQEVYLPDEQLDFLSVILKACKLNVEDIAIVNTAHSTEKITDLVITLKLKTVLIFGEEATKMVGHQGLMKFVLQSTDGVSFICSPALEDLNIENPEGKLHKRKLWDCLKQLFNV
ncbi:MAG: hypothetical protein WKF89_12460 [Chitinophagaceae bacterium]